MEKRFQICSKYTPSGDQPKAIKQLVDGIQSGYDAQTLLGITGSGKTFTIANVIEQIQKEEGLIKVVCKGRVCSYTSSVPSRR